MGMEIALDGRKVLVLSYREPTNRSLPERFVALLPAFGGEDRSFAEANVSRLVASGCVELCCAGPGAELVHDALDDIIVADGIDHVVTTWIEEPAEAVEYFLWAACGASCDLVAVVEEHPMLMNAILEQVHPEDRRHR